MSGSTNDVGLALRALETAATVVVSNLPDGEYPGLGTLRMCLRDAREALAAAPQAAAPPTLEIYERGFKDGMDAYRAAAPSEGGGAPLTAEQVLNVNLIEAAEWAVYALEHGSHVEVHWLQTVAKEKHAWARETIAKARAASASQKEGKSWKS